MGRRITILLHLFLSLLIFHLAPAIASEASCIKKSSAVSSLQHQRFRINGRRRRRQRTPCKTTLQWSPNGPPSQSVIDKLFNSRAEAVFNHDFVGITNPFLHATPTSSSSPFPPYGLSSSPHRILRYTRKIGKGQKCYENARDAALSWDLHRNSTWAGVRTASAPRGSPFGSLSNDSRVLEIGNPFKRLVTLSRIGKSPLWIMNPCRVVYDLVDVRGRGSTYTSTAYSTLHGHLLAGEERVTVVIEDERASGVINFAGVEKNTGVSEGGNRDVYIEILSCSRPTPSLLGRMVFPFVKNWQERFFMEEMDTLERIGKGF